MYVNEFPGFGAREWIEYYDCLNAEVPVDKLRLELTEEGKKCYLKSLETLRKERKTNPKVSYEIKYSWFE